MNHRMRVRSKLAGSRRLRAGLLLLSALAAAALFAELIAADAPIVAVGRSGLVVLPAVTHAAALTKLSRSDIETRYSGDVALWPLVRQGPLRRDAPGLGMSSAHPLGTDSGGRDVLCALCYGARSALAPALLSLLLAMGFGTLLGGLGGYLGGSWDELLSRPIELVQALPVAVVAIVAMAASPGHSALSLALAVAAVRWAEIARVVRACTMGLRAQDHVAAARALGAGPLWILRRHVIPHAGRAIALCAVNTVPALVLLEAALSFLGVGAPSSWGTLIAEGLAPGGSRLAAACAAAALVIATGAAHLIAEPLAESLEAKVPAPR